MGRVFSTAAAAWFILAAISWADDPAAVPAGDVEFFEKQIRPLFAEHCYQCHGPEKQESGLVLSTVAGMQNGGDRGSTIVPGNPDASVLIQAVRYTDDDLKMPPRGKLKDEQIADLVAWINRGALLPKGGEQSLSTVRASSDFNLEQRRKHWSYQPVNSPTPPLAGTKRGPAWLLSAIDAFILARLDEAGLSPSPPAAKRTLIRRLTFDLTGLPPSPDEVRGFLADETPDAYERLVDRFLASPRYGERFGRHWLDVVRYSESLGFEFDYDLHNAWRYRDYVIRAFNADLPYDQFVIEHLAGDLVPQPRRHVQGGTNESILATGFLWMHEGKQTPVDIRQDQADRIDNQLDVLGKAFLGQTIACARCHDHKFDAISTRDYYALAGYLRSSRYQQAFIDSPEHLQPQIDELAALRAKIEVEFRSAIGSAWQKQVDAICRYLLAAASAAKDEKKDDAQIEEVARAAGLDAAQLKRWMKALADESLTSLDHPLHVWSQRGKPEPTPIDELKTALQKQSQEAQRITAAATAFESFRTAKIGDWFVSGHALGSTGVLPVIPGQAVIGDSPSRPLARLTPGGIDSGLISNRLQGELRSRSFTIDKKFVHIRLSGRNARVNLVIDGYTLIMNPMYGKLTAAPSSERLIWRTMPVDRWVGHRAFIEVSDSTIPMHGLNPPPSPARVPTAPDGHIVLDSILFSDDPNPPIEPSSINQTSLHQASDGLHSLATAYQQSVARAIGGWQSQTTTALNDLHDDIALLNWLLENGLLDTPVEQTSGLTALIERFHKVESELPAPHRAPAIADGTGEDEFVFLRGNYRAPGERASRDLPQVLATCGEAKSSFGSGRLDLAQHLVDPRNPLLPRVLVNRLWQHHFGEGIVRTPDDFGRMGQAPTHPELLDHLANELIRAYWSMKTISRRMVTSSTYRQGSEVKVQASDQPHLNPEPRTPNPLAIDPENRLLHRMPIRRLEAEAIRDSVLAVAGQLADHKFGPSVLPHITSHMEGRGKPQSGPLDGQGRRSIYINARRNFLTPFLLAFDYPVTFTPIGRRGASSIPAQALTLMNDPFVVTEAESWAEKTLAEAGSSTEQRIETLYQTAFARPPTADELATAIDFLQEQSLRHGGGSDDPRVWTDLCHVLINVKEFIFID